MKITRLVSVILLLYFYCSPAYSQLSPDSLKHKITDSSSILFKDSANRNVDSLRLVNHPVMKSYFSVVDSLLSSNRLVNVKSPAVFFTIIPRQKEGKEFIFYVLCIVLLILGVFKTFYSGYFRNLFRVFFNTSIRQTQLTDQLMQATLPSLILNIFFAISSGFYIWLLFKHYHPPRIINGQILLPFCMIGVGALYLVKYSILKFIGWISGMRQATDNYIFVIFLVNKIAGIILIPFIILLEFAKPGWNNSLIIFSLMLLGLFFLSRYLKTYSILENRFPLTPLHFVIYIIGVEIIPLLVIYKLVVDYVI